MKPSEATQQQPETTVTRRSFLHAGAVAAVGGFTTGIAAASAQQTNASVAGRSSFLDLLRLPDAVVAYRSFEHGLPAGAIALSPTEQEWRGSGVVVRTAVGQDGVALQLTAETTPLVAVHVRWRTELAQPVQVLGDAWERSYGDLGWRDLIPERVMPWYFATFDGAACHAYGVQTHAAALCFWQLDSGGTSLWLNVANGGNGVELGRRSLDMARVVTRRGEPGEPAMVAVTRFCKQMCASPSRPTAPIFGTNDWNYSYGHSTAQTILRDAEFLVELSPRGSVRPFAVIDDGYKDGSAAWPSMGKLAESIRQQTARPGLWIRPLKAPADAATEMLLPGSRFGERKDRAREFAYDPTHPEGLKRVLDKVKQAKDWGYEMVKHDFSSYELLGQWGFEMGPQPSLPGWSLHDRTRTNAEVITDLYRQMRAVAGEALLLEGCNTMGHLGQGIFDLQRTGDDTSGRQWERTRRMGVNTLAFRLPQHATFFAVDADLVGITEDIPWELNRQWLDVLARSGAVTMVSPGPPSRGPEQRAALRDAFAVCAAGGTGSRPVDWLQSSAPEVWRPQGGGTDAHYRWTGAMGASPYLSA